MNDRDKVRAIAELHGQLMAAHRKKAAIEAELIRWCVKTLQRDANEGLTYLTHAEKVRTRDRRAKDKRLAVVYLEYLATRLEDQSTEGELPCTEESSSILRKLEATTPPELP